MLSVMNTSKLYFIQKNNGAAQRSPKSVIFGFRSKTQVEYVKWHLKYPFNDVIQEIDENRYLLKTHFNEENKIERDSSPINGIKIQSRNIYDAAIICGLNNLSLSIVDHVYDKDDGDIELCCIKVKDLIANGPAMNDDIYKYNLELLYKSI